MTREKELENIVRVMLNNLSMNSTEKYLRFFEKMPKDHQSHSIFDVAVSGGSNYMMNKSQFL